MKSFNIIKTAGRFPSWALVRRDLLRALRRVRPFLGLLLLAGISAFYVIALWPNTTVLSSSAARASSGIMLSTLMLWMISALVGIPSYAGSLIVQERERDTFTLLHMTLISPSGLVFGCVVNSVALFLLFVCATLPIGAAGLLLVGYDWGALFLSAGVILTTSITAASASTFCSVTRKNTRTALTSAFLLTLLFVVAPALLNTALAMYLEFTAPRGSSNFLWSLNNILCPVITLSKLSESRLQASHAFASMGIQLLLSFLTCAVTTWVVKRRLRTEQQLERTKTVAIRYTARFLAPFVRGANHRWRQIPNRANPIYAREVRWEGIADPIMRLRMMFVGIVGGLAFSLALVFWGRKHLPPDFPLSIWIIFEMGVACYMVPSTCGTALSREGESNNLTALRLTLLRPWQVVIGKAMAGMRAFVPYFCALLLPNLVMIPCAMQVTGGITLLVLTLVSTAVCIWVSVCMSLLASAFSRRASAATGLAYLFCATALFLGFYVFLLGSLFFVGGSPRQLEPFFGLMITSPMLGFGLNMTEEMPGNPLTPFWIANVVICTIWPFGAIALAAQRWRKTWNRDSE